MRYELPDAGWELITDLVSPEQKMGRLRSNDWLVLNSIFWILCYGAAWRDLSERLCLSARVYQRFRDWRGDGTLGRVLERLHVPLNQEGLIDRIPWGSNPLQCVQPELLAPEQGGREKPIDRALGCSRGGLTTKINQPLI